MLISGSFAGNGVAVAIAVGFGVVADVALGAGGDAGDTADDSDGPLGRSSPHAIIVVNTRAVSNNVSQTVLL